ncbi:MAG: DUF6431 domain-containing protein [Lachnospiraceae bacterium]|nr:DUF6431 domain-containing protein [Lachnospiraceae bacterium]
MQIMFSTKASVNDYHNEGKSFSFPNLTQKLCPNCKKRKLNKHGFYSRYFISKVFTGHILIRRHICPKCGKTVSSVSSLPFFCHPRRTYSTEFIVKSLTHYYNRLSTLSTCLKDFLHDYGVLCSRHLLYRYRKRFLENLNFLSMEMIKALGLKDFVYEKEIRKRAKQVLSLVHHTAWTSIDVSIKLFKNSRHSYLTHLHFIV